MSHQLLDDEDKLDNKQISLSPPKNVPITPPVYIPPEEPSQLSETDDQLFTAFNSLPLLPSASCQDHPGAELYYSKHIAHMGFLQVCSHFG